MFDLGRFRPQALRPQRGSFVFNAARNLPDRNRPKPAIRGVAKSVPVAPTADRSSITNRLHQARQIKFLQPENHWARNHAYCMYDIRCFHKTSEHPTHSFKRMCKGVLVSDDMTQEVANYGEVRFELCKESPPHPILPPPPAPLANVPRSRIPRSDALRERGCRLHKPRFHMPGRQGTT